MDEHNPKVVIMKIAWFTPFCENSAIGQVSKTICEELQKYADVDLWVFDKENIIQTFVPIVFYEAQHIDLEKINKYDHVVYNMGNYAKFHKEIWDVMQKYKGILVLHDQLMQNFFTQITMMPEFGGSITNGEVEYLNLMNTYYGVEGVNAAKGLYKPYFGGEKTRFWDSDVAITYPLFEPLLSRATGIFTHASFFAKQLQEHFFGPISYAYLPYELSSDTNHYLIQNEFVNSDKTLIVSNGMVHPLKRIGSVVEMLQRNPDLAEKVNYVVIGGYGGDYGDYLLAMASGPLKNSLFLLGHQPLEVMEAFLRKADFCVNLRYPNSEVCSKSLIEQMSFGKSVIVVNSGIYGEMPDDCVFKIDLENEIEDLEKKFRLLLNNSTLREETGKRAAAFVENNCISPKYVTRFLEFLETIVPQTAEERVVYESMMINASALNDLSFNHQTPSGVFHSTWNQLNQLFSATNSNVTNELTLGVWLGFPYRLSLHREGITKYLLYLIKSLLERFPIEVEIWAYAINEAEIRRSFDVLFFDEDLKLRVKIITEKNYETALFVPRHKRNIPKEVNEVLDNLADVAREFSKASKFVTAIYYLDNIIGAGKQIFVPVHDLGIHAHYEEFVNSDPLYKARFVDVRSRIANLSRAGALMLSNSDYVRQEHILKYVNSIELKKTAVVYLPVNIPKDVEKKLLSESELRERFRLQKTYIFYPTQIRPYKNVVTLVKALSLLLKMNIDIELVLTGDANSVPEVAMEISRLRLEDHIFCLPSLTEYELFSLYRHAAVAVVPTLFEGGFPWQACEALYSETPLVLSNIPVVKERIEFTGMTTENCGILLFDPTNAGECARSIVQAISDREKTVELQRVFRNRLLKYTWADAAEKYYNIFFEKKYFEKG